MSDRRLWFILIPLAALALLLWRLAPGEEEPAPATKAPSPSPDPPVEPTPSTAPPARPPKPAPVAKALSPEALVGVARALGGQVVLCADPALATEAGQTGAVSGQMRPPVPDAWPGDLIATLDARGLSLIVPNVSGAADADVLGAGTLEVRWVVEPGAPARCAGLEWTSQVLGVFGVVRDGAGAPIHGALVSGCGGYAVTDAAGEFFFDANAADACDLIATVARGGVTARSAPRRITPYSREDVTDLVLIVEDPPPVPAEADADAQWTAQHVREHCATLEQIWLEHGTRSPSFAVIIRPELDACDHAEQLLASGADPRLAQNLLRASRQRADPAPTDDGQD